MSDFPTIAIEPLVTIHPWSQESCGAALSTAAIRFNNTAGAVWPTANKAFYVPFKIAATTTIVKGFVHNGATVSGNVDVGIYNNEAKRLVSSGSIAQATINVIQELDLTDTTLLPGSYYMALAFDNTTTTPFTIVTLASMAPVIGMYSQTSAFALPATATFASEAGGLYLPVFGLTTRSVV